VVFGGGGAPKRSEGGPPPPKRVGDAGLAGSDAFAAALLEAVGVGVHLQDVDVVGDAIEQCAGEPFGAEDLGPLVEWQVAGDQRRGALVALADGLEEQLGSGLRQRHISQFVDKCSAEHLSTNVKSSVMWS